MDRLGNVEVAKSTRQEDTVRARGVKIDKDWLTSFRKQTKCPEYYLQKEEE